MVLEPGQRRYAQGRIHLTGQLADRPGRSPVRPQVQQFQPGALLALGVEGGAEQLIPGAHGEHHGLPFDRLVQPAVGDQPLGGQRLWPVLAPAEQVDVGLDRYRLVRAHLDRLDRQPAQVRAAGQDQQVAPVAVGGQQVSARMSWKAV